MMRQGNLSAAVTEGQTRSRIGRKLAEGQDAYLDVAIYHCQQAVEKAMKGFLTFHNQRVEKTHDLTVLVGLAQRFEPGFHAQHEAAERLTPYATLFRYPGEVLGPEAGEFRMALDAAEQIVSFILASLPGEVRPG